MRRLSAGRGIAGVVAGAWRAEPSPLPWSEEFAALVPLLVRGGVGALAWQRIRRSEPAPSSRLRELQDAYRFNALQAAVHRRALRDVAVALQAAGIAALLGKGWAAACLYPEPGLRPPGDIDLYVPGGDVPAARAVLEDVPVAIDLHAGAAELDDRPWDDLIEHSDGIAADGVEIRTFGREDHLRLLALHMLRHGAWRPLWLCDVAAAVESASDGFDWDRVRGGDRRRADAVAASLKKSSGRVSTARPPRCARAVCPAGSLRPSSSSGAIRDWSRRAGAGPSPPTWPGRPRPWPLSSDAGRTPWKPP